jgi:hypothetical protein
VGSTTIAYILEREILSKICGHERGEVFGGMDDST